MFRGLLLQTSYLLFVIPPRVVAPFITGGRMLKKVYKIRVRGFGMSLSLLLLAASWGSVSLYGQAGLDFDFHKQTLLSDQQYRLQSEAFENAVYRYMSGLNGQVPHGERSVYVIPVVVHVMHLPEDDQPLANSSNLTDQQVEKAISHLNQAFRNAGAFAGDPQLSNANVPAADVSIEFCLAQVDPYGQPTNGITRVPTSLSNLYLNDPCPAGTGNQDVCLKNLSRWDTRYYLNIWVVNNICTSTLDGCLINGYSLLPGAHGTPQDGIVIEREFFGTTPQKATELIHEAGHYMGLFNTYYQPSVSPSPCENGNCLTNGDAICDTPPDASRQGVNCLAGETMNSCSSDADDTTANNPFTTDVEDLYENFMDDGAAACRNSFTPMQKVRMRFALINARFSLLGGSACVSNTENIGFGNWIKPPVYTCDSSIAPSIQVYNSGDQPVTNIQFSQRVDAYPENLWTWTGNIQPGDTIAIQLPAKVLPVGKHSWRVEILSLNGGGFDDDESDNRQRLFFFRFPSATPISDFPFCEDLEQGQELFDQIDWDGIVGFDFFPYDKCEPVTGKSVLRYNSSGLWSQGTVANKEGTKDAVYSQPIDLRGFNQATFSFYSAYKQGLLGKGLGMKVWVLPSCGEAPELVYERAGADLESSQTGSNPTIVGWEPSGCGEWNYHEISLRKFTGDIIRVIVEVELEAEYSQNFYLDNLCVDASDACLLPTAIPAMAGLYRADTACLSPDGWVHFWKYAGSTPTTAEDVLLFSAFGLDSALITNLQAEKVSMAVTANYGKGGHDMSDAAYVRNEQGWYVAGRYWSLEAPGKIADSVRVRIYFDQTDLDDLKAQAGNFSGNTPPVTVFRIGVNPDPQAGHEGIGASDWGEFASSSLATGSVSWQMEDFGNYFAAEFSLSQWDGLGFGISGDGQGYGPTYPPVIEITSLEQDRGVIRLDWRTPKELGAGEYQVLRREFGQKDFEVVGTVSSMENSWIPQLYTFIDQFPLRGRAEYSLRLSHDLPILGTSDTLMIEFDLAKLVTAYPNPSPGEVRFKIETEAGEPVHASIYNSNWQKLVEKTWRHEGEEAPALDVLSLAPGIYYYVVRFLYGSEVIEVRGKVIRM